MGKIAYNDLSLPDKLNIPSQNEEPKKEDNKPKLLLKDGTKVPGATTICGQLDKPYLVKWANNLGKQGIDVTTYTKGTATLGTLIHTIIESHITKTPVDLTDYKEDDIQNAEYFFFNNYMPWERQHNVELIFCEQMLVSEIYKYGGIIDCYCKLDGKYTVVDFKTSKDISNEHILQVSSYIQLLKENGYEVEQLLILNVKKEKGSPLEEKLLQVTEVDDYWNLFKILVDVYWAKKKLEWK